MLNVTTGSGERLMLEKEESVIPRRTWYPQEVSVAIVELNAEVDGSFILG